VSKFWIRNQEFLLDLSIKKISLLDSVAHIIVTYGGHSLKGYLPLCAVQHFRSVLRNIMLDKLQESINKFQGYITLWHDNVMFENEVSQFHAEKLIAFNLVDVDEIQDLIDISLPHS
jgi:hypothetical protein